MSDSGLARVGLELQYNSKVTFERNKKKSKRENVERREGFNNIEVTIILFPI